MNTISVLTISALLFVASNSWADTFDAASAFEIGFAKQTNPDGVWSYAWSSGFFGPLNLYTATVQNGVNGPDAQYWLSPSRDVGTSPAVEI